MRNPTSNSKRRTGRGKLASGLLSLNITILWGLNSGNQKLALAIVAAALICWLLRIKNVPRRKIAIGGAALCGISLMFGLKTFIDNKNRQETIRRSELQREAYRQKVYKERDFRDAHIKFSKISAKITERGDGYNIVTISGTVHNIAKRELDAPIRAEIDTVDIKSQWLKLRPNEKQRFRIELLDEGELRTSFPKSAIKVYLDDEREL